MNITEVSPLAGANQGEALTSKALEQPAIQEDASFLETLNKVQQMPAATFSENMASSMPLADRVFSRITNIDQRAVKLSEDVQAASASDGTMEASEVVMLSVKSHEFMFHAQLASSIANKASEGIQQLFRQQS